MGKIVVVLNPAKDVKSYTYMGADRVRHLMRPGKEETVDERDWVRISRFCNLVDSKFVPVKKEEIRVLTPDGIGDLHWVFLKLGNLKKISRAEKLILCIRRINKRPDRVMEFADMNPVVNTAIYVDQDVVWPALGAAVSPPDLPYDYLLNPNVILERGGNIENWMPTVPVEYDYALNFVPGKRREDLVVIYMGDTYAQKLWAANWGTAQWAALIKKISERAKVVVVGLECDRDRAQDVLSMKVDAIDMIGKTTFAQALDLVTRARVVIGSVSGLTIVGASRGANALVMWPGANAAHRLPEAMQMSWIKNAPYYTPISYDTDLEKVWELFEQKWGSSRGSQASVREGVAAQG